MDEPVDWLNNPHGLPAGRFGKGERSQWSEADIAVIAQNPITLVALEAAARDVISLGQAMCVGYKPMPRWPRGLTTFAAIGAYLEAARRTLDRRLLVTDEMRSAHAYIYKIRHSAKPIVE